MSVHLRVYAELNDFVKPDEQYTVLRRLFRPHQTVKDVVEAAGVPHTEVDLVLVNGESVDFDHRPRHGDRITAYPVFETLDIARATRVRPRPLREPRFVADVNLGGLAKLVEVIHRLDLAARLAPFTRCLRCGGAVAAVAKTDVEDRLELLTRRYYDEFRRCTECGRVYWRGSHQARLNATVAAIRSELNRPGALHARSP